MCGAKPNVDNTVQNQMLADAKRARKEEEARKARINTGTANIDGTFGQFDQGFFDDFLKTNLDYYQPQLDKQFGDAKDQLTFGLARAGTLKSSVANQKTADLTSAYGDQKAGLVSDATGAATDLRGRVQNEKSSLVSLLNATGDADRASNEALSRSQVLLQEQPKYNPLGDIFGGIASGIGNYYAGNQNRNVLDTYYGRTSNPRSGGSSRTVGG